MKNCKEFPDLCPHAQPKTHRELVMFHLARQPGQCRLIIDLKKKFVGGLWLKQSMGYRNFSVDICPLRWGEVFKVVI